MVNAGGPFAVLEHSSRTETEIKTHITITLGEENALQGVLFLQDLGLERFPVNATHKIIRSEVEAAVLQYPDSV